MQQIQSHTGVASAIGKYRYVILAIIMAGTLMSVLDALAVNIALPSITATYGEELQATQWVITAYLATMTCLLLVFGKLSEYTGKVRLFSAGMLVFTLSSVACGLSGFLAELVAFRIAQAIGAAMMFSIGPAIVFQVFPPAERGRALGYLAAIAALGSILGPVLGGTIIDLLGWKGIFFINVPIGFIVGIAALKYLRIDEQLLDTLTVDWPGAVLSIIAITSLMVAMASFSAAAINTATVLVSFGVFLASAAAFAYRESKHRSPLLDLSLFRDAKFTLPLICAILFYVAHITVNLAGPFYYEGVLGYSATQVGVLYMIVFAAMVLAAPVSGWLYDRYHSRYHSAIGMGIIVLSLFLLGFSFLQKDILLIGLSLAALGVGDGLFQTPNNVEIMNTVPQAKLGVASGVTATTKNLALALGASFVSLAMASQSGGYLAGSGTTALTAASANTMFAAGGLCVLGVALSLLRNKR